MSQIFTNKRSWSLFIHLTWSNFLKVVKHPGFIILTLICLSFLNSNFIGNVTNSEFSPTTGFFINQIPKSEFPIYLMTLFFVGEIVWRERHLKVSVFMDAYPFKNWVLFSSKIVTVFLMQLTFSLIIILFGVLVQYFLFHFDDIDLSLYVQMILGYHLLYYWIATVGFFFLQVLAPNKYIGFLYCGLAMLAIVILPSLGVESYLIRYGVMPNYKYSEVSGLSPFNQSLFWYTVYWLLCAIILYVLSFILWPRGENNSKLKSLKNSFQNNGVITKMSVSLVVVAFIACYIFISINKREETIGVDNYALYENAYQRFESRPMPSIQNIKIEANLYPEKRFIVINGSYNLLNKNSQAIDTLLISFLPKNSKLTLNVDNELIELSMEALGTRLYRLKSPMTFGDSLKLEFNYKLKVDDFDANRPNLDLLENGMLLTNVETHKRKYFPFIGYDRYTEIQDSIIRGKQGLPKYALGWKNLDDKYANASAQLDWINYEAIISTSKNQKAISNGMLIKEWNDGDRRYFHFKSDTIITNSIAIVSGRYEKLSEHIDNVKYNIYYHPNHSKNINEMLKGLSTTITIGNKNNLNYNHSSLSVVEIPNYHQNLGTAYAMPTLTLWNEDGGFLSTQSNDEEKVNKVYSTALHEASHQWWAHAVKPAKAVKGGVVLNETLAQYYRLLGIKKRYQSKVVNDFLNYENILYEYGKSAALSEEPLLTATQNYIAYNKGILIMNKIEKEIGYDNLNEAINNYYQEYAYSDSIYPTTKDLLRHILMKTPDTLKVKIRNSFEKITAYGLGKI